VGGRLLGVAGTSAPVYVASTGNSVLGSGLSDLCPWTVGIQINVFPPFRGQQDNVALNANAGLFERQDAPAQSARRSWAGRAVRSGQPESSPPGPVGTTAIPSNSTTAAGSNRPVTSKSAMAGKWRPK
jgi:hypothetical protein